MYSYVYEDIACLFHCFTRRVSRHRHRRCCLPLSRYITCKSLSSSSARSYKYTKGFLYRRRECIFLLFDHYFHSLYVCLYIDFDLIFFFFCHKFCIPMKSDGKTIFSHCSILGFFFFCRIDIFLLTKRIVRNSPVECFNMQRRKKAQ